jgi:hypothetical protein
MYKLITEPWDDERVENKEEELKLPQQKYQKIRSFLSE